MGIGLLLVAAGLLLMATTTPTSGWTRLLPGFLLAGAGIGLVNPVLASSSVAVVPVERSGMGSGANSTFRQVGIATGIAGLGAVFASQIQHHTTNVLNSTPAGRLVLQRGGSELSGAMQSGSVREAAAAVPAPARNVLLHAYRIGFSHTFNELMVIGAVIAFVGAVLTLVLVRQRDFVHNMVGAPAAGAEGWSGSGSDPAGSARGTARQGVRMSVAAETKSERSERPAPRAARSRGRPRDERVTRAITEAALRQLLDEGYARLSMESVASEAGVARATVYRRFKDKADLVTAAIAGYAGRGTSGERFRTCRRSRTLPSRLRRPLQPFLHRGARWAARRPGRSHRPGLAPGAGDRTPPGLRPGPSRASPGLRRARPQSRPRSGPGHARRGGDRPGGRRPGPGAGLGPAPPSTWCGGAPAPAAERPALGPPPPSRSGPGDDLAVRNDEHRSRILRPLPPSR